MTSRLPALGLAIIVGIYVVLGVAFALRTPRWQAPDEPAHFNYIRYLAENRAFPVLLVGDYDGPYLERLKSARFPDSMPIDGVRYEAHQPPLYYLLATPVYLAVRGLTLDQQMVAIRLLSVTLGALLLLVAYAVARRVLPGDGLAALAVPALVAAVPQHLAMTAAINNDTLGELILSLLLLGVLVPFPGVLLGLLLGLALLTKTNVYVALLLVPLGLWLQLAHPHPDPLPRREGTGIRPLSLWERAGVRVPPIRVLVDRLAVIHAVALGVAGWWFVRNLLVYGGLDVFAWQRHDLVVLGQRRTIPGWEALHYFVTVTFRSFWVQIGWMAVPADDRTYQFLLGLSAVAALGLVVLGLSLWRGRTRGRAIPWQSYVLLAVTLALVFGTMAQYNLRYVQPQGRYLFYAIVPIAVFLVLGLREVGRHRGSRPLLVLFLAGLGYFVLTQLRDLAPPRADALVFAVLASGVGAITLLAVREVIWPRLGISPSSLPLVATYLALIALDLSTLFRLVPLLA